MTCFIPPGCLLSFTCMCTYMQIKAALSHVRHCISCQTVFILCLNFILDSAEGLTPVDFPSLGNSRSEVRWSTACANISQISAVISSLQESQRTQNIQVVWETLAVSQTFFRLFLLIPPWLLIRVAVYFNPCLSICHLGISFSKYSKQSAA